MTFPFFKFYLSTIRLTRKAERHLVYEGLVKRFVQEFCIDLFSCSYGSMPQQCTDDMDIHPVIQSLDSKRMSGYVHCQVKRQSEFLPDCP